MDSVSEDSIVTQGTDILGTVRGVFGDLLAYQGLKRSIDAEQARPFYIQDAAGNSFAVGPGGQLYVRGQTAGILGSSLGTTGAPGNQLIWLAVLIGGAFLAIRAVR